MDSLPPEDLLNTFNVLTFSIKIVCFLLANAGAIVFAIYVMDGKKFGGIAFLNKTYNPNLC